MRIIFLIVMALAGPLVHAQVKKPKVRMSCDTVVAGSSICLGDSIIQFRVTVISPNLIVVREFRSTGSCYREAGSLPAGSVLIFDEIIAAPKPGLLLRVPSRKYYIH